MERVSARELKNRLGRYLKLVRHGHSLEITDRGRPVACLVPQRDDIEDRLQAMARLGMLELARAPLQIKEPEVKSRASVAELLIEDR